MKIAAASCAKVQSLPDQPAWAEIQAERPDVLLLLGDNIYLDHDHHSDPEALRSELSALYATAPRRVDCHWRRAQERHL